MAPTREKTLKKKNFFECGGRDLEFRWLNSTVSKDHVKSKYNLACQAVLTI